MFKELYESQYKEFEGANKMIEGALLTYSDQIRLEEQEKARIAAEQIRKEERKKARIAAEKARKRELEKAEQARKEEREGVARNMKNLGVDAEIIAQSTGLSIEDVTRLDREAGTPGSAHI
jgi:predicted transposase/invertase (TIGR01784 family)